MVKNSKIFILMPTFLIDAANKFYNSNLVEG